MSKPMKHRVGTEAVSWWCFIKWLCTGCSCFNTVRRSRIWSFALGFVAGQHQAWVYSSSKRHQRNAAPLFVVFIVVLPLILHPWLVWDGALSHSCPVLPQFFAVWDSPGGLLVFMVSFTFSNRLKPSGSIFICGLVPGLELGHLGLLHFVVPMFWVSPAGCR